MIEQCNIILYRYNRESFTYKKHITNFNLKEIHILIEHDECFYWIMNNFRNIFCDYNLLTPHMMQIFPYLIRNEGHFKSCYNALEQIGDVHFTLSILKAFNINYKNLVPNELGLDITNKYLIDMAKNNCYVSWILRNNNFLNTKHVDDLIDYISTLKNIPNQDLSVILLNTNVTASQMEKIIVILKKGFYNFRYLDILDNENVRYSLHVEQNFDTPELQDLIEERPTYLELFIKLVRQEPLVTQFQAMKKFPFLAKYGFNLTELDLSIDFLKDIPND